MNKNLYIEYSMSEPLLSECGSGQVVVFTSVSPSKSGQNEDCSGFLALDNDQVVLMVADGLGGLPAGHMASAIAINTMAEEINNIDSDQSLRDAILSGFESANSKILETSSGSATTLTVAELQGNTLRTYHTGDSPVMVTGQRGKLKLLTLAHSPVGYAVEAGVIDEDEAIHHEERHFVSNVVGSNEMSISLGSPINLSKHDTLLLASDGLFDNLYQEEIIEAIRKGSLLNCAHNLKKLAHQRMRTIDGIHPHHPDDLSFILYRQK